MFLPNNVANANEEKAAKKRVLQNIEDMAMQIIPEDIRKDVELGVQEIKCGDPMCAPIDTIVTIVFASGGGGMMGLPMESREVDNEILKESFPTEEILRKWHRGEDADWPPEPEYEEEEDEFPLPQLRFDVGTRVECRISATEWVRGTISQLWYRERNWPEGSWAPYRIHLDDGRDIFAPGDMDQIIRRQE